MTKGPLQPRKRRCRTCPFNVGSPHTSLAPMLAQSAMTEATRICHSSGNGNALYPKPTGLPELACRGSRDIQLRMFTAWGFLPEPTDAAWNAKLVEMGMLHVEQSK